MISRWFLHATLDLKFHLVFPLSNCLLLFSQEMWQWVDRRGLPWPQAPPPTNRSSEENLTGLPARKKSETAWKKSTHGGKKIKRIHHQQQQSSFKKSLFGNTLWFIFVQSPSYFFLLSPQLWRRKKARQQLYRNHLRNKKPSISIVAEWMCQEEL